MLRGETSPLILLSIWRGDGALVQCHAFCSTASTIECIQTEVVHSVKKHDSDHLFR